VKRNIVIFSITVIVVAFLLFMNDLTTKKADASPEAVNTGIKTGQIAPGFELRDLNGKEVKLSDFRGKAVVLNFWATWCSPCRAEIPWFEDFQKQYGPQGLQVIGVAMDDSGHAKIAEFAKQMGMNYPVLFGREAVGQEYGGVDFLPSTFYIDRQGRITDSVAGIIERKDIENKLKVALGDQSQHITMPSSAPPNTVANSVVPNRSDSTAGASK